MCKSDILSSVSLHPLDGDDSVYARSEELSAGKYLIGRGMTETVLAVGTVPPPRLWDGATGVQTHAQSLLLRLDLVTAAPVELPR